MKHSLLGTSIIEAIIVLLVIVTWITWVYGLLTSSQKLADSTSKRIEAIQIARDGLEAFTNIRDTNWTLFSADYENCWNVLNYDRNCIWSSNANFDISHTASQWLILFKNINNQFTISQQNHPSWIDDYSDPLYRNSFGVQKLNGFYTQDWWVLYWVNSVPYYTREIRLNYIDSTWNFVWPMNSNNNAMQVTVIVQWNDLARQVPQKLEMSTILTNWKSKQ